MGAIRLLQGARIFLTGVFDSYQEAEILEATRTLAIGLSWIHSLNLLPALPIMLSSDSPLLVVLSKLAVLMMGIHPLKTFL